MKAPHEKNLNTIHEKIQFPWKTIILQFLPLIEEISNKRNNFQTTLEIKLFNDERKS